MYKKNYSHKGRFSNNKRPNNTRSFYSNPSSPKKRLGKLSQVDLIKVVEESKTSKSIQIKETVFAPQNDFTDFNLSENLLKNIISKGYTLPTPIQDQVIPLILQNKDVIGIANTGTGKTASFLIPLIQKVTSNRNNKVLIITPTRELAMQISQELIVFARGMNMLFALCIGGSNMFQQKRDLSKNPNFVIGTPGRIKDLMNQKALRLNVFNNVVLDETDRMVDIGFVNEIKYFISFLPQQRQSLFFSATVSSKVKEIIETFVKNPVTVSVKQNDSSVNINQEIIKVKKSQKVEVLHDLLILEEVKKTLIFGRTKWGVDKLSKELIGRGFKADAIHGDKRQGQRQRILSKFKADEIDILLATDVASRGLDISDVTHVINYDIPESYEDYVHRIGRTGRGNKKGTAVTFLDE